MASTTSDERVVGIFDDEDAARRIADDLGSLGGTDVAVGAQDDRRLARTIEHRQETSQALPGFGIATGGMARGALLWAGIGMVVGALLLAPLALAVEIDPSWSEWAEAGLLALIGLLAGGAAGMLFGGGRRPELEHEQRDTSHDTVVAATVRRGSEEEGAVRTALVDAGAVLVATAERTARGFEVIT